MTSLEMSTDDERPKKLNEINQHFDINVKAVDINKSGLKFELDKNTNSIYYSISSVKQVGAISVPKILEEREQNGFFFSLAEFVERIPKKFANKRVVINLILCGAFDEIENIKNERDRFRLIDEYTHQNKIKDTIEEFTPHMHDEFWWQMQKVELSGIGFLNYEKKAIDLGFRDFKGEIDSLRENKFISIGGICTEIEKKKNDNGNWAIITINCNNELIKALAWQNFLEENESKVLSSKGKFLFLSGVTKADYFDPEKRVLSLNNNSKIEVL
jgi:DNA polymerase-3 subunit alpha